MEEEKFEDLLRYSIIERKEGLVKGVIVKKLNDGLLINLGIKTDKFIPKNEFTDEDWNSLNVNDEINVLLRDGNVSYKEAKKIEVNEELKSAMRQEIPIKVTIKSDTKGGFIADYKGFQVFIPGSHAKGIKDIKAGDSFLAFVKKVEDGGKNIVCSINDYQNYLKNKAFDEFFCKHAIDDIIEGEISNIIDKGVFINTESIEAFLPFSEITYKRINSPADFFSINQRIRAKIIKLEKNEKRVVVSTKALEKDPFEMFIEKHKIGDRIEGIVRNIIDKGVFVEILDGLDGFIPISEISWTERVKKADKYFKIGDKISVIVKNIDYTNKKISLSFKDLINNPWEEFRDENPVGSIVQVYVKDIVEKGIIVTTKKMLEAFIPNDLIGYGKISEEKKNYKVGDKIEAKVKEIDVDKRRIILSIKDLLDDPFNLALANVKVGDEIKAKISGFTDNFVFFEIMPKVEGIVRRKEFTKDDEIKVGNEFSLLVKDVDEQRRKYILSIEEYRKNKEKKELEEYRQKNKITLTLGDFFKR